MLLNDTSRLPARLPGGVLVQRRMLLTLSLRAMVAASLLNPITSICQTEPRADGCSGCPINWKELLERASKKAARLMGINTSSIEEAYLAEIGELLLRLNADEPLRGNLSFGSDIETVNRYDRFPIAILLMWMAPRAAIPYHDHRNHNGALRVLSGEVHVRNFEIIGEVRNPQRPFRIRQTRDELLHPGNISTLSLTRDNIHDLRAGEAGATIVDLLTSFGTDSRSVPLRVDFRTKKFGEGVYEARWLQ